MLPTSGTGNIDPQRCIDLLADRRIGRIAWRAADGVQILPVAYAWYRESVVFRTSPYGMLSELVREADVAFEIDEVDADSHSGWSVVVHGRARATAEPEELRRYWQLDEPVGWASGTRNLFIQITPTVITGRRVGPQASSAS